MPSRVAGLAAAICATLALTAFAASTPEGWLALKINDKKKPTLYEAAIEEGKAKLPKSDQTVLRLAKKLSGQDLPYATLMYIWSNTAPVGTIIPNPHTRRIQMIVASSGSEGVGAWQDIKRDVAEDFRRAFKEEPGKLLAYGLMSDTDNTGESIEAWYGEIAFAPGK